jgi:putative ABC transport system permease protein
MDNLVVANILFRKTRTLVSIAGVALGVVLVVLVVGLVHGFLNEQGRRNSAVTAEIWFRPTGGFNLSLSGTLAMDVGIADQLRAIEGVRSAVPIGNIPSGSRIIDGVEYEPFTRVSAIRVIEGRPIASGDEAIVDKYLQQSRRIKVGDSMQIFDRAFQVVGVYDPESIARIKIPLSTMQQLLNRPNLCSLILVKVEDPARQEEVAARIKERFPQNGVDLTRDIPIQYARGVPALQTFLDVVVVLAIVVSSLVILLAMYTTVVERTRQIGILKSLGASKAWIAGEIEKEALLISLLGALMGFGLSVAGKYIVQNLTGINVDIEVTWLFYSFGLSMLAGAFGALYPALRAANQDPVKALSYE